MDSLTELGSNDDLGRRQLLHEQSRVFFTARKDVVYRIAVDGRAASQGSAVLDLLMLADPRLDVSVISGDGGAGSVSSSPRGINCGASG